MCRTPAFFISSQASAAGVRRRLGVILHSAILFVDSSLTRSIYTSENKASVYSNSGFHLVDASSRRHAWTGAVSYKARSHAALHILAYPPALLQVGNGGGGGMEGRLPAILEGFTGSGTPMAFSLFSFIFFLSLSPKFITS